MRAANAKPVILIVDDMVFNIEVLSELLGDDYKIKIAKNGAKALEIAFSDEKPDLILLDIEMPEMDGFEVCRRLKNSSETSGIPIIFVTAKNDVENEEFGLNLGAVDYIYKPYRPSTIKIRVKNQISLKLKSDKLEEYSMIDGLTNIYNRRYFDDEYTKKYKEMAREKKTLAVFMIDVDFFKRYNDHYGHGKGDDCLIKLADTLNNTLKRPTDMVARYGGEEFVVVLYDIDLEGAKKVAQSLVSAVKELSIPHEYSDAASQVTISLGMAFKEADSALSKEEILKNADEALYRAKESGRDKVSL